MLPPQGTLRQAALVELVKFDLRRRWQTNAKKSLEEYLKEYPDLGTPEVAALAAPVEQVKGDHDPAWEVT